MLCPICNKRKAKRWCPAHGETICSVCCGTEREVTIDCPSDCDYLKASRDYELTRLEFDPSKLPFPEVKFTNSFARNYAILLVEIDHALCLFASQHREVVDADVFAVLQTLAETYRTQTSGLIYEKPIDYALQRSLYEELKKAIAEFREKLTRETGATILRDSEVRDSLIFLTQLCAAHTNGRPKGRAYLDLIRQQFPKDEFRKAASNIVLL